MKIGILSDTHGDFKCFEAAMTFLKDADVIIHCGDVLCTYHRGEKTKALELVQKISQMNNICFVQGNGDTLQDAKTIGHSFHSPALFLEIGEYRIYATHGHHFSRMQMIMKAKESGANILCYGHSHIKELDSDDELLILNPGSPSLPRDGSPSCAVIENHIVKIYDIRAMEQIAQLPVPKLPTSIY